MFTAQGAQLPLRTKSAAKVLLFFDICKRSCDFLKKKATHRSGSSFDKSSKGNAFAGYMTTHCGQ